MRGLVLPGDRRTEWRDFPEPEPGPGEVVVRMRATAVCGSDLHQYRMPASERVAAGLSHLVAGHEPCGVVERVGPGPGPRAGDRVVVYHHTGCGACSHCLRGEPMHCHRRMPMGRGRHGADSELVLVPSRNCLPLPDDFSDEEGTLLACNVGTAYCAMKKANASGRGAVAVIGLGPVGQFCVQVGRAMGAAVVGVDPAASRRRMAERLGTAATVDPGAPDAAQQIARATGRGGPAAAVDTSGVSTGQSMALDTVAVHGTVVFVGVGGPLQMRPFDQVIQKEITIAGSWIFKMPEWEEILDFVRRHRLPISDLVTHRFAASEADEAFRLADAAQSGKIVLNWA